MHFSIGVTGSLFLVYLLVALGAVQGSQYVSYVAGDVPLVITAPHGGSLKPSSLPERSIDTNAATSRQYCGYLDAHGICQYDHQYDSPDACADRTCLVSYLKDSYTGEIATGLADRIEELIGKRPHLVKLKVKRNKVDVNRPIQEATFGDSDAEAAYDEYASMVEQAKAAAGSVGLLLDIHGQTHSHGMVELSYNVYGSKLDCGLACFSLASSSIRGLIDRRCGGGGMEDAGCQESTLRGTTSLGHFLAQEGYEVVPSPAHPGPNGDSYFSGGYTVRTYGSKDQGQFDAIQIEIPRYERFDVAGRAAFIDDLGAAVVSFVQEHYDL